MNTEEAKIKKSFTLIEVVVVMAIMGLIVGGLMTAMKEIIDGEVLLKKMQQVEGESRFIMDLFAQDAQYSELASGSRINSGAYQINFLVAEKKLDLGQSVDPDEEEQFPHIKYSSSQVNVDYDKTASRWLLKRNFFSKAANSNFETTLHTTPLKYQPLFLVQNIDEEFNRDPNETDILNNRLITISLVFEVKNKETIIHVPIQTSVVSRTFEF